MGAVIIELGVLAAADQDDARTAVERLAALGTVVVLSAPGDPESPGASLEILPIVQTVGWLGVGSAAAARRQSGGRSVEPIAAAALTRIQANVGASWMIATEATVPIARSCPGLRVVCVGPALDGPEPTRPDHRVHSLLDAARLIETFETFA